MKKIFIIILSLFLSCNAFAASQTFSGGYITTPVPDGGPTSRVFDTTNNIYYQVIQWPATGKLNDVYVHFVTVTSAQSVTVNIETLSSGVPSGSLYVANATGTIATPAAGINTCAINSTTGVDVVGGEYAAIVFSWTGTAGTAAIASNAMMVTTSISFPYYGYYTTSWQAGVVGNYLQIGLEYGSTKTAVYPIMPFTSAAAETVDGNGTTRKLALAFNVPFPCTVSGFYINLDLDGNGTVYLRPNTDPTSNDITISTSYASLALVSTNRTGTSRAWHTYNFSSPYAISAGTDYLLAWEPGDDATTINVITQSSANYWDWWPGGQNWRYRHALSGGWQAVTTTKRPMIIPIFNAFSDGVASGAGGSYGF